MHGDLLCFCVPAMSQYCCILCPHLCCSILQVSSLIALCAMQQVRCQYLHTRQGLFEAADATATFVTYIVLMRDTAVQLVLPFACHC